MTPPQGDVGRRGTGSTPRASRASSLGFPDSESHRSISVTIPLSSRHINMTPTKSQPLLLCHHTHQMPGAIYHLSPPFDAQTMRWMQKSEFDHTHHTMLGILVRGEYCDISDSNAISDRSRSSSLSVLSSEVTGAHSPAIPPQMVPQTLTLSHRLELKILCLPLNAVLLFCFVLP